MASVTRTFGILIALLVSGCMIGAAFFLSGTRGNARSALAEPAEEFLAGYASKDTDNDGLPDWKETLYGTDPKNPRSARADIPDGEAVARGLIAPRFATDTEELSDEETLAAIPGEAPAPDSLTESFSRSFIEQYLARAANGGLDDAEEQTLVNDLLEEFSEEASARVTSEYAASAVRIDPSLTPLAYATALGSATGNLLPADGTNDISVLMSATEALIMNNDSAARAQLEYLADDVYTELATRFKALPAAPGLADEHAEFVRAFDSVQKAARIVANYEQDPVLALGALPVFHDARRTLILASVAVGEAIRAAGDMPAPGTFSARFIETADAYSNL